MSAKRSTRPEEFTDFAHAEQNLHVVYPDAEHDFPQEIRDEVYRWLDDILKPS